MCFEQINFSFISLNELEMMANFNFNERSEVRILWKLFERRKLIFLFEKVIQSAQSKNMSTRRNICRNTKNVHFSGKKKKQQQQKKKKRK